MQKDWDARARRNAAYFVDFGAWRTEEEIEKAGTRHAQLLIDDIPKEEAMRMDVLEIGCGIGRVLRPLAARVKSIAGIDVSLEMLWVAAQRVKCHPGVALVHNDGTGTLPFKDRSFDLVFSCFVFEHVPWTVTARYLTESCRVLRPEGRLRFQFIVPFETVPSKNNQELVSVEIPEGVEALARGPTFEGDPIPADDMRDFLLGLEFMIESIEFLGVNNVGISARLSRAAAH
jgi:SAM-dependent methyltransferase